MPLRHTLILLCFTLSSLSAEWSNWRGPNFNLTTSHQNFPNEFSDSQNVLWSADLPGEGASTPAIWKNSLYITCMDKNSTSAPPASSIALANPAKPNSLYLLH